MRFMHDPRLREIRFGACLLVLPLLAGCGGGGGGGGSSPTPIPVPTLNPTPTPTPTPPPTTALSVSVITATGLTATLSEASSTVGVNGTLTYTETLTNSTAAAIPIRATTIPPTAPAAGLTVRNSANNITFQPLPGFPALSIGSLAPGQSLTSTVTANGFTAASVYTATATFGDDVTAPAAVGPLTVTAQ